MARISYAGRESAFCPLKAMLIGSTSGSTTTMKPIPRRPSNMPAGEGCASNGTSRGRSRLPRMCQPSSPGDLCRTKQTTSGWRPDHLRFEVRGSETTGDLYMKDETHFRSEERRVGKGCVSTCKYGGATYH